MEFAVIWKREHGTIMEQLKAGGILKSMSWRRHSAPPENFDECSA